MVVTILIVLGVACGLAILASAFMTWASDRSALWSMMLGSLLAIVVLIAALIIALLLARRVFAA